MSAHIERTDWSSQLTPLGAKSVPFALQQIYSITSSEMAQHSGWDFETKGLGVLG